MVHGQLAMVALVCCLTCFNVQPGMLKGECDEP
jgi:hypothetical protein